MKVYEKVPDRKHNAATKRTNERENAVFFRITISVDR